MTVFDDSAFDDHERVLFCRDVATGLKAIVAIHSTALGPAAGGCRLWRYESDAAALHDVLRLSQGMSYKNAMAGLRFGGGKAVILKDADFGGGDALFEKFGEFVDQLNGSYITAEDVGMSVEIMETVARRTRYVTGLSKKAGHAGGDPSPKTAWGIFKGIEAAVRFKLGREELRGLKVAVQGVGHVGYNLCRYLAEAGAELIVADMDEERLASARRDFGAAGVSLDALLHQEADVLAPCALGAILNERSIPKLNVKVVAGAANNQLESAADGARLAAAGILYAPDYVINAGGIINVAAEYYGTDDDEVMRQIEAIGPRLRKIFEEAASMGQPTNTIADEQARKIIAAAG
ncbi:MAG TPA: Glu/Leu/Phe/Val dehydrogenase dimerization domain-containing protein [Woeseiaceae bacterium]|jgi:leucine dehydrogenase|nr:Glu/Leu/Phe/Val dehydrogenase dimerization domain-containing protein [Woeseiaceae bacterium]